MRRFLRLGGAVVALTMIAAAALAQNVRGVIVDQTGLPLPGATVHLHDGEIRVASTVAGADGTFSIDAKLPWDTVVVSLDGFETARVPRSAADRITLAIVHSETTIVIAPAVTPTSPTATLLGNSVTTATVARMPSSRMKPRESLPLLPSVLRGPDGLMQLGGARAHDAPLLIDSFNVTDPATGLSSINLPYEAVRGVEVLRDPMAVTYGGLLGGLVKLESNPGGDRFRMGVQGVVPRPRFTSPGFGRIEGIFPRMHMGGAAASGRVHYFTAAEYDYERIPVPDVTQGSGPDIIEQSATLFTRVDAQVTPRQTITLEGLAFPSGTQAWGLSPRREENATADLRSNDWFAGLTHRFVAENASVVTVRLSAFARDAGLTPRGNGASLLSPDGWRGNWFAEAHRNATRYTALATWERVVAVRSTTHDVSVSGEISSRRLRGTLVEAPIVIENAAGQVVRRIDFGPPSALGVNDRPLSLSIRDVWQANERLQVDGGIRLDYSRYGGGTPSGRVGIRYVLDRTGATVLKAGYGSFVGSLPLAVPAFGGHPERRSRDFDPTNGALLSETVHRPTVGALRLPHAVTTTVGLERQLRPGLDAQVVFTMRDSTRLATLEVPEHSGDLNVQSSGSANYREVQFAMRRSWEHDQQIFMSYVRSSGRGELNDFTALFQTFDAPILQPGGISRLSSDARHRVLVWGTFDLPSRVVVSPVTEWRTGFPYSALNERHLYAGRPNDRAFPNFISTDLVIYKTFTVRRRSADLGVQLFNVLSHANPRDVFPVTGTPRFGQFTNSVGRILRGYMLLKWE